MAPVPKSRNVPHPSVGDDGLYAPPPPTEAGGEGSHSTRPGRLEGVCVVQADAHGHWSWTLNHQGPMCVSHPYSTYTSPEGEEGDGGEGRVEDTLGCPSEGCFISKLCAVH